MHQVSYFPLTHVHIKSCLFLFPPSSLSLPPITQEEALTLLGFTSPFTDIKFGPFTGNATVMRQVESAVPTTISQQFAVRLFRIPSHLECIPSILNTHFATRYACRWFKQLCNHRDVSGKAYYFYKPVGKGKTFGMKPEQALAGLKEGLQEPHTAFIYHCWNHYFCPVGFEEVPKECCNAYR